MVASLQKIIEFLPPLPSWSMGCPKAPMPLAVHRWPRKYIELQSKPHLKLNFRETKFHSFIWILSESQNQHPTDKRLNSKHWSQTPSEIKSDRLKKTSGAVIQSKGTKVIFLLAFQNQCHSEVGPVWLHRHSVVHIKHQWWEFPSSVLKVFIGYINLMGTGADPGFWSGGPSGVLTPRGGPWA